MTVSREIRIRLEDNLVHMAHQSAKDARVDISVEPKPEVIDPFTVIVVGGGSSPDRQVCVDLWDRLRGGMVIDLRPSASELVRRDSSIPAGFVVIFATDGNGVKIEVHDAPKDASERLLERIIDGTLSSAAEIAKEAAKVVGVGKVSNEPRRT